MSDKIRQIQLDKLYDVEPAVTSTLQVDNAAPTLAWNTTSVVGTVDGVDLTVKMPANPVSYGGNGSATTVSRSDHTHSNYADKTYVDDAIAGLPEPMIFKGSLGTGGTITSLPTAAAANEGFTYKVITAGTYASKAAKVGDTFISTGSAWELIPSGDEPSGTVTSVGLSMPGQFTVTSSPVTSSGTLTAAWASQTKNTVLAAPNGSDGTPSFRALVAADIPSLAASKITSGTIAAARLPAATSSALGGVKVSFSNGVLTITTE